MSTSRPWPPGAATGIGSLPGTDPVDAATLVFGELPDFAHLPELPARGPGADLIGRSAALLVDLPAEIAPSGWRLTARPGRDLRRAADLLARDLDAFEQAGEGYQGAVKVQVAGPWTLAAGIELPSGHRVLTDPGAVRDLAASLAEGVRVHVDAVRRRIPAASVVLQLDEPSLPAVLAGMLPTASGYGTVRAIDEAAAQRVLADVLSVVPAGARAVHCCAADVPIELVQGAGADALAVDAAMLGRAQYDALGAAVDAGLSLWLGVVPGTDAQIDHASATDMVRRLWHELGFAADEAASDVVPTPACGLNGATPAYVRRALSVVKDVGKALLDDAQS